MFAHVPDDQRFLYSACNFNTNRTLPQSRHINRYVVCSLPLDCFVIDIDIAVAGDSRLHPLTLLSRGSFLAQRRSPRMYRMSNVSLYPDYDFNTYRTPPVSP